MSQCFEHGPPQVANASGEGEWKVVCPACERRGYSKGIGMPLLLSLFAIGITWWGWVSLPRLVSWESRSRYNHYILLELIGGPVLLVYAWWKCYKVYCDDCNGSGFRVKTMDEFVREGERTDTVGADADQLRGGSLAQADPRAAELHTVLPATRSFSCVRKRPVPDLYEIYKKSEVLAEVLIREGRMELGDRLKRAMFGATSGEILADLGATLAELRKHQSGLDTLTMIQAMTILDEIDRLLRSVGTRIDR